MADRELRNMAGDILLGGADDTDPIFIGASVSFEPVAGMLACGKCGRELRHAHRNEQGEVICSGCHETVAHLRADVEIFD